MLHGLLVRKKKKPLSDCETVKDCTLAVHEDVVNDDMVKKNIISSMREIPIILILIIMSDTATIRKIEALLDELKQSRRDVAGG